jgi:hypothetical protein
MPARTGPVQHDRLAAFGAGDEDDEAGEPGED